MAEKKNGKGNDEGKSNDVNQDDSYSDQRIYQLRERLEQRSTKTILAFMLRIAEVVAEYESSAKIWIHAQQSGMATRNPRKFEKLTSAYNNAVGELFLWLDKVDAVTDLADVVVKGVPGYALIARDMYSPHDAVELIAIARKDAPSLD